MEHKELTLSQAVGEEIGAAMLRHGRMKQRELAPLVAPEGNSHNLDSQTRWLSDRLKGHVPIDLNELERIAKVLDESAVDWMDRAWRRVVTIG